MLETPHAKGKRQMLWIIGLDIGAESHAVYKAQVTLRVFLHCQSALLSLIELLADAAPQGTREWSNRWAPCFYRWFDSFSTGRAVHCVQRGVSPTAPYAASVYEVSHLRVAPQLTATLNTHFVDVLKTSLAQDSVAAKKAVETFAAETLAEMMSSEHKQDRKATESDPPSPERSARWKAVAQRVQASAFRALKVEKEDAVRGGNEATALRGMSSGSTASLDENSLDWFNGEHADVEPQDDQFGNVHAVVAAARRLSLSRSLEIRGRQSPAGRSSPSPAGRVSPAQRGSPSPSPLRGSSPGADNRPLSRISTSSADSPPPGIMDSVPAVVARVMGLEESPNGESA